MSPDLLLLVFAAAALHAAWNLVSKQAAGAGATFVLAYRFISTLVFAPWAAYVLIQDGMPWNGTVALFLFLTSFLHLCYGVCLQYGYQSADISVVYPVARGTGPLLATMGAFLWLGEQPTVPGIVGIACVVCGVLLIATQGRWRQFARPEAWVGARWGLTVGFFIACYTLTDAYSVKSLAIAPVVLDWIGSLGMTCMLAPGAWVQRRDLLRKMRGRWRPAIIVGVISPLGYIFILYALRHGAPVSLVAPLRETSLMLVTIAGYFFLKESVTLGRWAGCAVILAGVVALSS
jgi:drug/metabolite transporter (DMT)-like permease